MVHSIAIIDDDDQVRFAVQVLFEVSGFEVDVFASAEEFLECQQLDRFACILVDFRLPGLSGLELLLTLKKRQISVPALVSSGFMSEQDEADCVAAGAAAIVYKPVEGRFLVETVHQKIVDATKDLQRSTADEAA